MSNPTLLDNVKATLTILSSGRQHRDNLNTKYSVLGFKTPEDEIESAITILTHFQNAIPYIPSQAQEALNSALESLKSAYSGIAQFDPKNSHDFSPLIRNFKQVVDAGIRGQFSIWIPVGFVMSGQIDKRFEEHDMQWKSASGTLTNLFNSTAAARESYKQSCDDIRRDCDSKIITMMAEISDRAKSEFTNAIDRVKTERLPKEQEITDLHGKLKRASETADHIAAIFAADRSATFLEEEENEAKTAVYWWMGFTVISALITVVLIWRFLISHTPPQVSVADTASVAPSAISAPGTSASSAYHSAVPTAHGATTQSITSPTTSMPIDHLQPSLSEISLRMTLIGFLIATTTWIARQYSHARSYRMTIRQKKHILTTFNAIMKSGAQDKDGEIASMMAKSMFSIHKDSAKPETDPISILNVANQQGKA